MRFINYLVGQDLLTLETVETALERNGRYEKKILLELTNRKVLDPQTTLLHMSRFYRLPAVDLSEIEKDEFALRMVPFELAKRHGIFPVSLTADRLRIAVSDPLNFLAVEDVKLRSGCHVERVLASETDIHEATERHYRVDECLARAVKELGTSGEKASEELWPAPGWEDAYSPIPKTVQHILENAVQMKASDIHFEPQEDSVELRYRIDGDLVTIQSLPAQHCTSVVARIKILAHMDIAEQRKPQDGRSRITFRGRKVDLRISTLPTLHGEKVVIRLLNQDSLAIGSLEDLGLDDAQQSVYLKAITAKQGIVLVTGPTGSGKTTTLYASLNHIKSDKQNITTIEDPVEYLLGGVNQTQISPKIGVTFPSMLRSILRQDPDVILVGEVRDRETADIAFRGSLTGHLVFSTLHTNSAVGAVTRLFDLGLEPYLVSSTLVCVVAQRLVRVLCPDCREAYEPDQALLAPFKQFFGINSPSVFFRAVGCVKCAQTGFRGRMAIFEVLSVTDELRSAVSLRASEDVLMRKAKRQGFKPMGDTAAEKAMAGVIPLEDALALAPVYEKTETDLMSQLADFIDLNRKKRLLVVKSDELIRKILIHTPPEDYVLIEASPEQAPEEPLRVPEMPRLAWPHVEWRRKARVTVV